jgi:hypothetical protein
MEVALQTKAAELEPDVWMHYVKSTCRNLTLHRMAGFCHDCENRFFELQDKDVPILAAFMRLALCSKTFYRIVR